ncbi:MAG: hypothetical protein WCE21_01715 [Candidatus Babeliales bacterium]
MNTRMLLLTCLVMAQYTHAVITEQIELVDEGNKNTSHALYAIGLQQLQNALKPFDGHIHNEVDSNALKLALKTLTKAISEDDAVSHPIVSYFKKNELAQMIVLHGYVDTLLPYISCEASDWAIAKFSPPSIHVPVTQPLLMPSVARPFPCLTKTNSSCIVETNQCKTTYRLSSECDNLTRIIEHKKQNSNEKTETRNIPLDKNTFRSILIGNTNIVFTTSVDDQTHLFDVKPISLKEASRSFSIPCSEPMQMPHIELSPDETLLLFQGIGRTVYSNEIIQIVNGTQEYRLSQLKSKWDDREMQKVFSNSRWSANGNAIVSSPNVWNFQTGQMSPSTSLKLALYTHWFEKLKNEDLKTLDTHTIHMIRRIMHVHLPKDTNPNITEALLQEKKEFLKKHNLENLL